MRTARAELAVGHFGRATCIRAAEITRAPKVSAAKVVVVIAVYACRTPRAALTLVTIIPTFAITKIAPRTIAATARTPGLARIIVIVRAIVVTRVRSLRCIVAIAVIVVAVIGKAAKPKSASIVATLETIAHAIAASSAELPSAVPAAPVIPTAVAAVSVVEHGSTEVVIVAIGITSVYAEPSITGVVVKRTVEVIGLAVCPVLPIV